MKIPGIASPENVESKLLLMVSGDVMPSSLTRPKICDKSIYVSVKSF